MDHFTFWLALVTLNLFILPTWIVMRVFIAGFADLEAAAGNTRRQNATTILAVNKTNF